MCLYACISYIIHIYIYIYIYIYIHTLHVSSRAYKMWAYKMWALEKTNCNNRNNLPLSACWLYQSCLTVWDPMENSLPGSSVHRIFQARILEQVAISYSRDFLLNPNSGIEPRSLTFPVLAGRFLTTAPPGELWVGEDVN